MFSRPEITAVKSLLEFLQDVISFLVAVAGFVAVLRNLGPVMKQVAKKPVIFGAGLAVFLVACVAVWLLKPQNPSFQPNVAKQPPVATESHIDANAGQCKYWVTTWSDKNVSAVPAGACPGVTVRANSSATLIKVYPQEVPAGTSKVTLMVAKWSDNTFTCAIYKQPDNLRIAKPAGCTW